LLRRVWESGCARRIEFGEGGRPPRAWKTYFNQRAYFCAWSQNVLGSANQRIAGTRSLPRRIGLRPFTPRPKSCQRFRLHPIIALARRENSREIHGCCGELGNRDVHDATEFGEGARPRAPGKRVLTKGRIFARGFKTSWGSANQRIAGTRSLPRRIGLRPLTLEALILPALCGLRI